MDRIKKKGFDAKDFIYTFYKNNIFNIDSFLNSISSLDEEEKRKVIFTLKDMIFSTKNNKYENVKEIFDKLKKSENLKELIELITLYELQYVFGFMDTDERKKYNIDIVKKTEEILEKYSEPGPISIDELLGLLFLEGYLFYEKNNIDQSKIYFDIIYSIASQNNLLKEQERVLKIYLEKFFYVLKEKEVLEIVDRLYNLNENNYIYSLFFYKKKGLKLAELALSIERFNIGEGKYLVEFLNNLFIEKINSLNYNILKSISDISLIKKDYNLDFVDETSLKSIFELNPLYIDEQNIEKMIEDIQNDNENLSLISINFIENNKIDYNALNKIGEKYDYKHEENMNIDEYIQILGEKLIDNLDKLVDLLNIIDLKKSIELVIMNENKFLNIYHIFALFNLFAPKDYSYVEEVSNYFLDLNDMYSANIPYSNLGLYTFLKEMFLYQLPESEEIEKYLEKLEKGLELEGGPNGKLSIKNYDLMLKTLEKILRFEKLEQKDMVNIAIIFSKELIDIDIGYSFDNSSVNLFTSFVNINGSWKIINEPIEEKKYIDFINYEKFT